jgi:hypothetical protein
VGDVLGARVVSRAGLAVVIFEEKLRTPGAPPGAHLRLNKKKKIKTRRRKEEQWGGREKGREKRPKRKTSPA